MNIQALTHSFAGIPGDWIVIGFALIIVIGFTMLQGSSYATALSLSLPISFVLFQSIDRATFIGGVVGQFSSPGAQAVLFAIITAIMLVLANQAIASFESSAPPVSSIICGVATIIILIVFWIQLPALESIWHFGLQVQSMFGEMARFWWLLGAYVALAFSRR